MKTFLSVLLATLLLLGIAIPAAATTTEDSTPPLWSEYGFSSMEEMLVDYGVTEEEYFQMVEEANEWRERENWTDKQWDEYFAQQLDTEKRELGLIYNINVMLNNTPFTFDDAVPEIVNGRVMVPIYAVVESLGGESSYDASSKSVLISVGDKTLEFTLGGSSAIVSEGEEECELALDSAPYIKSGRVFVPLRFVAEALGYDVKWSDDYRTAVFLDKENIIAELDKNFTIANKVFSMANDIDRDATYKGKSNLNVKVTSLDSINGNKVYSVGISTVVLQNGTSMKMTLDLDIAALADLVQQYGAEMGSDASDLELLAQVLETMSDSSTELIMDIDSGMMYIRSAAIPLVLKQLAGVEIDSDCWIAINMGLDGLGVDFSQYTDMMDQYKDMTVGEMIYMQYTAGFYDCVYLYDYIMNQTEMIAAYGDDMFTKSGTGYTYDFEQTDDLGDYSANSIKVHANLIMNGEKLKRVKGTIYGYSSSGEMASQADISFSYSATEAQVSGTFQVKNAFNIEFTMTSSVQESSLTVPTQPPLTDKVLTIEEIEAMVSAAA